jgi:c-di-GMP-binding flagellar brake protein YcgR
MKLSEIPINARVQIRVSHKELRYECEAVVVAKDDSLYLTPIKHEGQLIDFTSDKIQILLFYVTLDRRVYGWSGCRIRTDNYQGKLCHRLTTKRDGVRVNRRTEPRIRTNLNAELQCPSDDKEKEVVVINYSENGVGFVCPSSIMERDWPHCTLVYEDYPHQMRAHLKVHIIRCSQMSNGKYRCGARILAPDDAWISYVHDRLEAIKERRPEPENGDNSSDKGNGAN